MLKPTMNTRNKIAAMLALGCLAMSSIFFGLNVQSNFLTDIRMPDFFASLPHAPPPPHHQWQSLAQRYGTKSATGFAQFERFVVKNRTLDVTQNHLRLSDYDVDVADHLPHTMAEDDHSNQHTYQKDSMPADETLTNSSSGSTTKPLNIVLFYADDWTMKVMGKLNKFVHTPNIDAMADQGMLFTHNCVTTSICWISRATLVTGQYASVHEQLKIFQFALFTHWNETLFPLLRSHNYYTGLVGKWHAPETHIEMNAAFDYTNVYYGRHWERRNGQDRHVTDLNGEDALHFLRKRPRDQKFALKVAFFATHAWDGAYPSYQPMNESAAWYDLNQSIPEVPTNTPQHWNDLPWFFDDRNEGRHRWKRRFDTPTEYQKSMHDLYRMASEVDAVVGAVVQELKDQNVYDDTLLIFTTDNGNLHGEHGLSEKWYPWEESVKVPLVIQDPRMPIKERGKFHDALTLSVDLAPTILSAAQIPVPERMQGRDMAQLYLEPESAAADWRQDFFYEWSQGEDHDAVDHSRDWFHIPAVFALIRRDWKYFYWPQLKYEQLFHVEVDPMEEYDIYNSTAQTNEHMLLVMKARYAFLKNWSQHGNPV